MGVKCGHIYALVWLCIFVENVGHMSFLVEFVGEIVCVSSEIPEIVVCFVKKNVHFHHLNSQTSTYGGKNTSHARAKRAWIEDVSTITTH